MRSTAFRPFLSRRVFSTAPPPPPPPPAKLPRKLSRYAALFAGKPVSYITSFLILHELTAIIPVGGIFWYIHTTSWVPPGISQEVVTQKMESLQRWSEKKGYGWFRGDKGARILLELGTAYAVVKLAMPARIAASVAAAPWFARRVVEPVRAWGARRWKFATAGAVGIAAAAVGAGQYFGGKQIEKE